jgi:hypothetical protein
LQGKDTKQKVMFPERMDGFRGNVESGFTIPQAEENDSPF